MSSLAQLLTTHRSLLVLDAASTRLQVGLLQATAAASWQTEDAEAGSALFKSTAAALQAGGLKLPDIGAFVFCEGPGSVLGVRTVAMAIRTWQVLQPRPAYAYQSLAVAGCFASRGAAGPLAIIADARRDSWHLQPIAADGSPGLLQRVPTQDLPSGDLLSPE